MAAGYNVLLRNAQLDAITTFAGNAALLRIYDGTRPATGGAATNLLAELTCATPFAGAASSGSLTVGSITGDTSADASGTATWYRLVKADGTTHVADGNVGVSTVTTISGTSGDATITVGSASGLSIGMQVSGTGIASGALIVDIVTTTVYLSINNTGTVSGNGTFTSDMNLVTDIITATQPVTVSSWTITRGNA
jgi:hypothetical protein